MKDVIVQSRFKEKGLQYWVIFNQEKMLDEKHFACFSLVKTDADYLC